VLLAPTPRAEAASLKDLWLRSDQQAAAALAQGDAKTAATVAKSPDWHGSAAYRSGDFEAAASDYAKLGNADGAYNEGNALAKLGKYEDAIAAYDRALEASPGMDDAKANKAAVEEFLKRQQKQQDKSQKPNPKSGKKDDKQSPDDKQEKSDEQQKEEQSGEQNDKEQQDQQNQGESESQQQGEEKEKQSNSPQSADQSQQKQDSSEGTEGSTSDAQAQTEPSEGKPSSEQQQALSKAIDKSLAQGNKPDKDDKPSAAVEEDDATQEKRQALEHLLQRVPDDPGGLLRRKFLLEHQRRQQGGDNG